MIRQMMTLGGVLLGLLGMLAWNSPLAHAGGKFRNRTQTRVVVPTTVPAEHGPYPMLGTFYPTPTIFVRGNGPAGGGYSPLGTFGEQTMALYGPLSSLRATTAPVRTYASGYDGRPVILEGTSFSTPNLPGATPVVYPTRANYYFGFPESHDPPWWPSAMDWIDHN
jgi:hypothetical protein